ncbi:MAG: serine/threonine protein kinase [Chloroflexi bacterium]|nr:serine/threonine protein kinase [Chloroflexota bacterium]
MAHEPRQQPEIEPEYDPESMDAAGQPETPPPQPASSRDLIGQTLGNRYRFDALLGEGTFARVFRVHDLHRRVDLAAKVLRSDIAQEPAFLQRFQREAKVLERLQHPNIVRYYDIVEIGDTVFILTDYIAGQTFQQMLRRRTAPLTPMESLHYLTPLAAALHFAHREGVVHRDLKPANILLDESNNLYVMDFGIARILSDASTLTVDTTVGTPHYMSPEQILVGEVTAATDIYALGVMLFQMYTGQLPFTGDSEGTTGTTAAVRIVYEHLHLQPEPPSSINPRISRAVEEVILRCMAKDPAQRYGSVSEVYDALNDAIGTPSMSLDAPGLQQSIGAGPAVSQVSPRAEPVPTGVGGASRIVPEDEAREIPEPEDYGYQKPKRKPKSQDDPFANFGDFGEKEGEKKEKETEKETEFEEKAQEKEAEKGEEKAEFWADLGPTDRLGQFTWGGIILWAGVVFLLETLGIMTQPWAWLWGGAGGLLLTESAARLVMPDYRRALGARFVFGIIGLVIGLSLAFSFNVWSLWPLALIILGLTLLINRLLE